MSHRPAVLLLPLLGIVLGVLLPWSAPSVVAVRHGRLHGPAGAAPPPTGPWNDPAVLQARWTEACDWAKEATKVPFRERPAVRAGTPEEVAPVLREEDDHVFRLLGAKDDAAVAAASRACAHLVLGVYDPRGNVVYVLAGNARRAAQAAGDPGLDSEDTLRLFLVHMGVRVLDRQSRPAWKRALDATPSADAARAAGAVLLGHAQAETKRVADEWMRQVHFPADAFDHLVTLLAAPAPADAGAVAQGFQDAVRFGVLKGQTFMAAVAHRGRTHPTLDEPPTDPASILDPQGWIEASAPKANPAGLATRAFDAAAPLWAAEGWTHEDHTLARADAETMLVPLEKRITATVMAGFQAGWARTASKEKARRSLRVLEFRQPGLAEAFANLRKSILRNAKATVQDGAGRDNGLPGFVASREVDGAAHWVMWALAGHYVLVARTTDDLSDAKAREPWDDAVEAAAELLRKARRPSRRHGR
jgi:hypothetical protein